MKTLYRNLSLTVLLFVANYSLGQNNALRCDTREIPVSSIEEKTSENSKFPSFNRTVGSSQSIPDTIHVVVHVLWSSAVMNIPDSMILKQLQILNEDFPRLNADTVNTPIPFQALSGALPVRFALAYRDTNGMPTTGIIRTQTSHGPFGFNTFFDMTHSSNGGDNKWDSRFMNIYCAEMSGSDGVGWMGSNICLINYAAFGNTRVGTHEMGHVFGLSHIWGPEQSTGGFVCSSDDGIADTPEQWSSVTYCGSFPLYDTCTTSGNGIMYMNYMNYNLDFCINMFSQGQVDLMTNTLNTTLNDLINNVQLGIAQVSLADGISVYPNPNNGTFKLRLLDDRACEITIVNSLGQSFYEGKIFSADNGEVNLNLTPGIYFCKLHNEMTFAVKKFIVE